MRRLCTSFRPLTRAYLVAVFLAKGISCGLSNGGIILWGEKNMISRILLYYLTLAVYVNVTPVAFAQQQGLGNTTKTFTDPAQMTGFEASDSTEIARSWNAAIVRIPTGSGRSKPGTVAALANDIDAHRTYPTVIYLHGCSGVWQGTKDRIKFYADNGFLVIAPVSFARLKYPKSCHELLDLLAPQQEVLKFLEAQLD
jgi:hypothetical protein